MTVSLKDRVGSYIQATDYKLLAKLPTIIVVNGRSFQKLTALLDKPFSEKLTECFCSVLALLVGEIDGAFFGYTFNDELVVVARNDHSIDTQQWCSGSIQKMASLAASIATQHFAQYAASLDLNLLGDPTFYASVFAVPNMTEALNTIIAKQQQAMQSSIYFACVYELLKRDFDRNDIKNLLMNTTIEDKTNLLRQECEIEFNEYASAFRRGVACYRSPRVVEYEGQEIIKSKWGLNSELPIFTKEHGFLAPIFKSGSDIIRQDIE